MDPGLRRDDNVERIRYQYLMELYGKLSRLFTPGDLKLNAEVPLDDAQTHYLKNVLRKSINDTVRIFNGRNGEFLAEIKELGKKGGTIVLTKKIREQPEKTLLLHLLFAPIKKARMDFLIEKATELGVTDLHPVLTARTENRHLNEDRTRAQIMEAAEQCERMTVPVLHPVATLKEKLAIWDKTTPFYWCFERSEGAPHLSALPGTMTAFLIGPEGGFDETEIRILSAHESVKPVSLGETVYRAETAAFLCLATATLKNQK
jgi:16S rRNA (uracil1498-N3)-methyltransferase